MSSLWSVIGIGFCALAVLLILKELRKEFVPLFLIGFSLVLFAVLLPQFHAAAAFIKECAALAGGERIEPVLKALGITFLTTAAAQLCRTAGETSVGNAIETAGRMEIFLLCLPLLKELLDLALLGS